MEGLAGMRETNLAALLDELRQNADSCKEEGNRCFAEGDMEGAVAAYTRAAELSDPFAEGTVVLYSNRAAALTRLGRFEAALADADAAVASRPDWAKAHFRRGAALFGARRFEAAAAAYEAGLELEPGNASLAQGLELARATLRQAQAAAAPDSSPLERALAALAAAPPAAPLPVLVLSGFLGAGKTTLLRRVLANAEGLRVAVVVNDMAELNIDSLLLAGGPGVVADAGAAGAAGAGAGGAAFVAPSDLVSLSNGCICCTLRDDLLAAVSQLAAAGRFDYLVIESTGISEPLPVAATFAAVGRGGGSLTQYAPLDSLVTVVDAARFAADWASGDALAARGAAAHDADGRAVAALLAQQVECADTLILNKCDLLPPDGGALAGVEASLRALNPRARLLRAVRGEVAGMPLRALLLHTGRHDAAAAAAAGAPGEWAEEAAAAAAGRPAAGHAPESERCGIRSVTLDVARPFHPARLWEAVVTRGATRALLRSKGFMWLASRPGVAWSWSTAGGAPPEWGPAAQWRADALPRDLWPPPGAEPGWDAAWGDRRQQLVLIGQGDAPDDVATALRACLLSDEELAAGEAAWEASLAEAHAATWGTKELTPDDVAHAAAAVHVHSDACGHAAG